ncbi:hypothetical protein HNP84_008774 [Thermocatellispora tengchongensis]|uniref:Uncharacterized protein n=1 Tax=Thermocatellispora tengchongensis TaxID=1073253 RepID=A0A840PIQ4_9ACTN|nr:hypothetical protein [Thermocatellispora tengchongensis]MBB5139012.1 hypothetical protein [Thermocatellispora tengchongensis]
MIKKYVLGGTAAVAGGALLWGAAPVAAATAGPAATGAVSAQAAPSTAAKKLMTAWTRGDRAAAAKVATPAAVTEMFSYAFRAPDKFLGCDGTACRFTHTGVRVPGGLNGVVMIVPGTKVTKVYRSRHITKPATVARHLYAAWTRNDRYRGLEVATTGAVKTVFRVRFDPRGVPYTFQGCSAEPKGYSCAYSYEGGGMFVHVRGSKTRGFYAHSVSYIAD